MRTFFTFAATLVAAALVRPVAVHAANDAAELQALRAQVQALEQQLRVISRQLELREQAAAAAAAPSASSAPAPAPAPLLAPTALSTVTPTATPTTATVTVADRGYALASTDGANSIRLRGLLQLDARLFFHDEGLANNALVLRRARVISEGQVARDFRFQFVTDFASSTSIVDANFAYVVNDALQLKVGRFKVPVGLELLQSDTWGLFNERTLVTNLVPSRDLGLQVSGEVMQGRIAYAAGVFNGVPDGTSSSNTDFDNDKDAAGRVMVAPFRTVRGSALRGLSVGVGGSIGRQKTTAGRTAGYRTEGQQTFFSYVPGVVADGPTWRVSPQLEYRGGPLGLLGEYVVSAVTVRTVSTPPRTLKHTGWETTAAYVLTGEDSSGNGVLPRANFDLAAGTWGAFELSGRVAELRVDAAAFPLFAAPAASADGARSLGVGLNWYLNRAAVVKFDAYHTRFGFNALAPAVSSSPVLRQDENAVITRFQLGF